MDNAIWFALGLCISMTNTYVYLLRHAQSAPSHDVPESEWPLSPSGIEQAENLVEQGIKPVAARQLCSQ